MKILIKILLPFVFLIIISLCISLIPLKQVPNKAISIFKVEPLSISPHGYIDIFSMQYILKNFIYLTKIDEQSYLYLSADNVGTSIFHSDKDVSVSLKKCAINVVTSKNINTFVNEITKTITQNIQKLHIATEKCDIKIKHVPDEDIKQLEKSSNIINDMESGKYNSIFTLKDGNINVIKNDLLSNYSVSGTIDNINVSASITKNDLELSGEFNLGGSKISYKKNKDSTIFSANISNLGEFIKYGFCNTKECFQATDSLKSANLNINTKMENNEFNGTISGFTNGKISIKNNDININLEKINIPNITDNQKLLQKVFNGNVSLYSIIYDFLQQSSNLNLNMQEFGYKDIKITNFQGKYDSKQNKVSGSAKINQDGSVIISGDNKQISIEIDKIQTNDIIGIVSNESLQKMEQKEQSPATITLSRSSVNTWFLSNMLYKISQDSSINYSKNECINNCNQIITFHNVNLDSIVHQADYLKLFHLDKYIQNNSGLVQDALMYDQSITVNQLYQQKSTEINFKNAKFNTLTIESGKISFSKNENETGLLVEKMNSSLFSGDVTINNIHKLNQKQVVNITSNLQKFYISDILKLLFPNSDPKNINIVPPSLIGIDGKVDIRIDDTGLDLSNISANFDINDGNFSGKNLTATYKNNKIQYNLSGSLVSKPIINANVGLQSINMSAFFKTNNGTIDGIMNGTGNLRMSGFSLSEILNSSTFAMDGKIYNLIIKNCNLQKLSNSLIDVRKIDNIDFDKVLKSGQVAFKEADFSLNSDINKLSFDIKNAKTVGASMAGVCKIDKTKYQIENCTAIMNVLGRDLSEKSPFYNLQISYIASGNIDNPSYKFNYDQINKYKQQAIEYNKIKG